MAVATQQKITFQPANDIQDAFIWGTKRESMFDGGVGNGKTTGGIMRLLLLAKEFPGSRWVIARQTYKDLLNTTKKTFNKVCPAEWVKRDVKEEMTLINGSEVLWLHLDEMSDSALRGLEINGAFISQAEEIAPEMWELLDSRVGRWWKSGWRESCPPYIWGDCNPNGHDWIYFRFDPEVLEGTRTKWKHKDGTVVYENSELKRAYYFGSTGINKDMLDSISPGYYESLMRKPEAWKRRWVYGSRDIFEGAIHPDFRKDTHVYNADLFNPFETCSVKSVWGWFDYGLSAPTCLLLSASTTDNFHFIWLEYYQRSTPGHTITIREHAAEILRLQRESPYAVRGIYADPSIFFESTRDRRTQTTSVAQEYRECGVYLIKADNNEVSSISNLQQLFHIEPELRSPVTGKMGSPRLFISSDCVNTIEQIQLQRHASVRNPLTGESEYSEDRAAGIPDHAYDPLRYFGNSNVWQAPVYRHQPPVPLYRTHPVTEKPVKGYVGSTTQPRANNYRWRDLGGLPEVPRVSQTQVGR